MAKTNTKNTKTNTKNTKTSAKNVNTDARINNVALVGEVTKVLTMSDKCAIYNVDVPNDTPNGNISHTWVNVVDFTREIDFEVGDIVAVVGYLNTNTYNNNGVKSYQLRVVADGISEYNDGDAVPFN